MNLRRLVIKFGVVQTQTTSKKKHRPSRKRGRKSNAKRSAARGGRGSAPRLPPRKRPNRNPKCCVVKSETACEFQLESHVKERPHVIDALADDYVAAITADEGTVRRPGDYGGGRTWDVARTATGTNAGGGGGRRSRTGQTARTASRDEYVVPPSSDRGCPVLLPPGTVVRKPSEKLVQLIAQAIYDSPCKLLRVSHVYVALQKRYPYFMYLEKKALNSWKSSVRHALFQKWFTKLRPKSTAFQSGREKSCFWGLNFNNRPREWSMPGRPKTEAIKPPRLPDAPPKVDSPPQCEAKDWKETSAMESWNTADTNWNGSHNDAYAAQPWKEWAGQESTSSSALELQQPLPPLLGPINHGYYTTEQPQWLQPYWSPWPDSQLDTQQLLAADPFVPFPAIKRQDWLSFAEPSDYYSLATDTDPDATWDHIGANVEVGYNDASDNPLAPAPALCSPRFCVDAPKPWEEAVDYTPPAGTVSRGTDAQNPGDLWPQWAPIEEQHPAVGSYWPRPKSV